MQKNNERAAAYVAACDRECRRIYEALEATERANTARVLAAFRKHRIGQRHFAPSTGYGYDDVGRDTLGEIFAELMGAECALVRPQIASGTHALALALQGVLRPGDVLVSAAGTPYDTMQQVIGTTGTAGQGSLKEYGIGYREVALAPGGEPDLEGLQNALDGQVRMVLLQRSRGYAWRPSLSLPQIRRAAELVRKTCPRAIVMVDNCYGEFTDTLEPGHVGCDLMAGSLIKNPGGGIAPGGGYVAGSREAVELVSYRLTCPGVGAEVGSWEAGYRPFYQGLFLAPHVTAQALKVSVLAARVFAGLGYGVSPAFDAPRGDIIQAIRFGDPDSLISFVRSIQACSPVDSEAVPEPCAMPGYEDPVIMAAGAFVAGSSIELSADAPIRPPYTAYLQGGLTYAHGYLALQEAVERLMDRGATLAGEGGR